MESDLVLLRSKARLVAFLGHICYISCLLDSLPFDKVIFDLPIALQGNSLHHEWNLGDKRGLV